MFQPKSQKKDLKFSVKKPKFLCTLKFFKSAEFRLVINVLERLKIFITFKPSNKLLNFLANISEYFNLKLLFDRESICIIKM